MMKVNFLYIIILFLLISCTINENYKINKIKSFPINLNLNSEVLDIDSLPNCPKYLLLVGRYIVLLNFEDCNNQHIHAYDKNTFEYMGSFGSSGRGPNELMGPLPSWQVISSDTLSGFWIKNQSNNRFELVNIEKSLKNNLYTVENNYYYTPLSEGRSSRIYVINEDNFIAKTSEGLNGRFYTYNNKTKSTRWIGYFPEIQTNSFVKKSDISILYNSQDALSKNGKIFISAVDIAKRIDIFDNRLNHQLSIIYKDSPNKISFPQKRSEWHTTFAHFDRIYVGNTLFYVLNNKMSLSGRKTEENPEVHAFSLDGKALARYQLNVNKRYEGFAIDEENSWILCLLNDDEGYPQIIRYRIPE